MGDRPTQSGDRRRQRSTPVRRTGVPLGSSFNDLFSGGASVWLKIVGGAIATPVIVVVFALRSSRGGGRVLPNDPVLIAISLAACAVIGAVLGALLSLKDVVQTRLADGKPVSFALKLLFGFGLWSLLFVWFPVAIVVTLAVTILSLG